VTELVREQDGPILVVRLNRPEARNALTPALVAGLGNAVLDAEADPTVRVLVLTGTGERAFCAGMDLRSFSQGESIGVGGDAATAAFRRLVAGEVSLPLVGAANASAVAGGLELLLGCDVVVVSETAQLGLPEVKRGLFAAGGGTALGTRVPLALALEMVLTGDSISAARALALGLVNQVVAPEDVLPTAMAIAERIARNAPLGLAASKELVRLAVADPSRVPERLEHWQRVVFGSEDAREGATAFVEKREPSWLGR
jgi:enoyl-CoA hydratase/carnithine racemase